MDETREAALAIIAENRYLNLATTDGDRPWVAVVEYVTDEHGALYFVSKTTSRHGSDIGDRAPVGVAIYDSRQPSLTGRGVQIEGTAERLDSDDNPFVLIAERTDMPPKLGEIATDLAAYRITPEHVFMPHAGRLGFERTEIDVGDADD